MKANRINQQTNFKGAYAKLNGEWFDLRRGYCKISTAEIRKLYCNATQKKGFVLSANEALFGRAGNFFKAKLEALSIALTEEDAADFKRLISESRLRQYFNQLLEGHIAFHEDLTVSHLDDVELIG